MRHLAKRASVERAGHLPVTLQSRSFHSSSACSRTGADSPAAPGRALKGPVTGRSRPGRGRGPGLGLRVRSRWPLSPGVGPGSLLRSESRYQPGARHRRMVTRRLPLRRLRSRGVAAGPRPARARGPSESLAVELWHRASASDSGACPAGITGQARPGLPLASIWGHDPSAIHGALSRSPGCACHSWILKI